MPDSDIEPNARVPEVVPDARNAKGQFVQGNRADGRKPLSTNFLTLARSAVTPHDLLQIFRKACEQARAGNDRARTFLCNYVLGPPQTQVNVNLTGGTGVTTIQERIARYESLFTPQTESPVSGDGS